MKAVEKITPVELGTHDFDRIGRLLRSADYALMMYRSTPNYPAMQPSKSTWWVEYQGSLSELVEAING